MHPYFSTIKISHGHGQVSRPFISLKKGIQTAINIEKQIHTIDHQGLVECMKKHRTLFEDDSWNFLQANYFESQNTAGLLLATFGYLLGNGDINYFKNQSNRTVSLETRKKKQFVAHLYQLSKKEAIIKGEILVSATSFKPVRPVCHIETTHLEFENGEVLTAFNIANIKVAEQNGDTMGIRSKIKKKLNISTL